MRPFLMLPAALLLLASSAFAETDRDFICRDFADTQADAWAQGRLERAGAAQKAGPGQVVVVMGGEKYLAPLYQRDVITTSLGDTLRERNSVYAEEFHRCIHSRGLALMLQN